MRPVKSISLFGTYEDSQLYSRNQSIKQALQTLSHEIIEFRPSKDEKINKVIALGSFKSFTSAILKVLKQWASLCKYAITVRNQRIILVPYPSHADILLLQLFLIGKHPIIIMDAFLGLHDTIIEDRGLFKRQGFISNFISLWEKHTLSIADIVLLDTKMQCLRLAKKYNLPENKFFPIPVGIDESVWTETKYPKIVNEFRVIFWGTFIPLHGVETIIDAASMIFKTSPNVKIQVIGKGQTAPQIKEKLSKHWPANLNWIEDIIPIEQIVEYAKSAHCILGIFGKSDKAASVIPYKIYQALAINRPVITRVSNAFTSNLTSFSIHTIEPDSPLKLAEKIQLLATNPELYIQQSSSPRQYYDMYLSQNKIKEQLGNILSEVEHA